MFNQKTLDTFFAGPSAHLPDLQSTPNYDDILDKDTLDMLSTIEDEHYQEVSKLEGIGIYVSCHGGNISPFLHRPTPRGVTVMKKNITECGFPAYRPTRFPGITQEDIAMRLTQSFDVAFSEEECRAHQWPNANAEGQPIDAQGRIIHKDTFTCEEFNTNSANVVHSFLYKEYGKNDTTPSNEGVLVAFSGVIVDLMTITLDEYLRAFRVPLDPSHPKHRQIIKIIQVIETYIDFRNRKKRISTDFIFITITLLHIIYGVKVARFYDPSCNYSKSLMPFVKPSSGIGYGGKKSKRGKRKHRKSKKLF